MRVISEERLTKIAEGFARQNREYECVVRSIISECHELNPWMTLEEFLKSGFTGWCWINLNPITVAYKLNDNFYLTDNEVDLRVYKIDQITHVIPIHKPEPPKL